MPSEADVTPDGRRARRERNRAGVIDAVFELVGERGSAPSVEEVAERAQVSVSSVFRYFDDLDDMHAQTVQRYFERFAPLFEVPTPQDGDVGQRIEALVDARLALYDAIAPLARMARARAVEHPAMAATLSRTRRRLARQVRDHFATDLEGRTDADDVAAAADALTAFESWDLLRDAHDLDRDGIGRSWSRALRALLG